MKFTIKNLEIAKEVKLEELQFEITSEDIKENGKNILNIIKEVKPLFIKKDVKKEEVKKEYPKEGTLDELLKSFNK